MSTKIVDDETLARLAKIETKATAGEWGHIYIPGRRTPGWPGEPGEHRLVSNGNRWAPIDASKPDADGIFVAAMRNAAPSLIDSILRLKEALAIARHWL